MTNAFIGIDPGETGGIAIIRPNVVKVFDLPYVDKRVDSAMLLTMLDGSTPIINLSAKFTIVVERQQFRPTDGKGQVARIFENYGRIMGVLESLCVSRILTPTPSSWKKAMGLTGKDKEASRAMAMHLFGDMQDELKRKKDHGRAEALLLAEYGRKQVK